MDPRMARLTLLSWLSHGHVAIVLRKLYTTSLSDSPSVSPLWSIRLTAAWPGAFGAGVHVKSFEFSPVPDWVCVSCDLIWAVHRGHQILPKPEPRSPQKFRYSATWAIRFIQLTYDVAVNASVPISDRVISHILWQKVGS